jgi:CBS domain-containing protein
MSLERFCRKPIATISPKQSIHDAAVRMRDQHVGAIVVVEDNRPVGIVTDRDIVLRGLLEGRDPETTPVRDVMSRNPTVVRSDEKIDEAVNSIHAAGVRRLPIVDEKGQVVGMVTLDDLVVLIAGELSVAVGAVQANRGH